MRCSIGVEREFLVHAVFFAGSMLVKMRLILTRAWL